MDRVMDRVSLRQQLEGQLSTLGLIADEGLDQYRDAAVSLLANSKVHEAFTLAPA